MFSTTVGEWLWIQVTFAQCSHLISTLVYHSRNGLVQCYMLQFHFNRRHVNIINETLITVSHLYNITLSVSLSDSIVELYNKRGRPLPPDKVLQLFYQVCKSVQHMHNRQTPIIHRDMKVCILTYYHLGILYWYRSLQNSLEIPGQMNSEGRARDFLCTRDHKT